MVGDGIAIWSLAAALLAAVPAMPSDPVPEPETLATTPDMAQRMTVLVHVNETGPYPFLVDTGSQRSILSAELARALALPEAARVRVMSVAGTSAFATVTLSTLRYGRQAVHGLTVPIIARQALGGPGLLGLDALQDKRLLLDFRGNTVELADSTSPRSTRVEEGDDIVVRARRRGNQLILLDCMAGDARIGVALDTGAAISVGNMEFLRRLRADFLVAAPQPVDLISVTGESVTAQVAIVRSLSVGKAALRDVPVVFTDAPVFAELGLSHRPAMLLGMQILRLFDRVAIDFGRRRVDFLMPERPGGR